MAKEVKWTCDGCDKGRTTQRADILPEDWRNITVTLSGIKVQDGETEESYDLCKTCQGMLIGRANPKGWARCRVEPG